MADSPASKPAKKAAKKAPAKKTPAKKAAAKKAPAKKAPAKKAPAKKVAPRVLRGGETITGARRLGGWDFATWRMASDDPVLRSTILGVLVLEESPDWDRLCERYERATRLAPVLRSKVVEGPLDMQTPRVVVDPDFDLGFHMRRFSMHKGSDWNDVLDVAHGLFGHREASRSICAGSGRPRAQAGPTCLRMPAGRAWPTSTRTGRYGR